MRGSVSNYLVFYLTIENQIFNYLKAKKGVLKDTFFSSIKLALN